MTSIAERLNEKNQQRLPYLYKTLLTPVFTSDGRWSSILADYSRVAADVIALDAELPVKSRDSYEKATGFIPKMGLKLPLTEKQMHDIDVLIAQGMPETRVIDAIFADTPRVIDAVYERIEDIFLSELSTGVGVTQRNNGTGVRIDLNFFDANKFGVEKLITAADATPLDDVQRVVDKSIDDQNTITDVWMDDIALNALYRNSQVRGQFAFNNGIATNGSSVIPILDQAKIADIFMTKWNINVHRVARKIKTEINGVKKNHNPWQTGVMAFTCDETLGDLVWTNTVESTRPVSGVNYQTVDDFILVSKYSKNDPLVEFTASQAMVLPVLNNVDRIYLLDTQKVQA